MKKASPRKTNELRAEYTRSDFPGGFVRGKYAARIAEASNIVVLEPQVAKAFPNSRAVNKALRSLLQQPKAAVRRKRA